MMDRFRRRSSSQQPPRNARQVSRREREESQRKLVVIGLGSAVILLVLILIVGATYQYFLLPNQTLARVGETTITRGDYWKVRKLELLNQFNQYSQLANSVGAEQAQQYQQAAEQARQQLQTVESDTPNTTTVERMVNNEVILQHMGDVGVSVSDNEIDDFITNAFAPSPLASPTPTLPIDPTAAAWQAASASPSPSASTEPSPSPENPDTASPSPSASPTPNPADVRATATATFGQYKDNLLSQAGMSTDDFKRLVVRPEVALNKVQSALQAKVPLRGEQVHAAHILVATEDAAKLIVDQTLKEKDFAQVAKDQSSDSGTAVNGGDLGWFPRGVMVKEFDDVAFSLQPGQVSQPVHTQFGWHVIKVMERENDRPVTSEMLSSLRGQAVTKWLDTQKSATTIIWESGLTAPTPTPAPSQFAPPPDSPPTPTPTPTPPPTPAPGEESPGPSATP